MAIDLPYLEKLSKFIIANPDKIFIIDEKLTTNKEKFIEHIKAYIDLWRPCLKPFMPEVSLINGGSYLKIYDNKEVLATKELFRKKSIQLELTTRAKELLEAKENIKFQDIAMPNPYHELSKNAAAKYSNIQISLF